VHEPAADLYDEEDVQAAQGDGVDGKEVTRQCAGSMGTDEVPPPIVVAPRRWPKTGTLN